MLDNVLWTLFHLPHQLESPFQHFVVHQMDNTVCILKLFSLTKKKLSYNFQLVYIETGGVEATTTVTYKFDFTDATTRRKFLVSKNFCS